MLREERVRDLWPSTGADPKWTGCPGGSVAGDNKGQSYGVIVSINEGNTRALVLWSKEPKQAVMISSGQNPCGEIPLGAEQLVKYHDDGIVSRKTLHEYFGLEDIEE